jgi:hypothetical protein
MYSLMWAGLLVTVICGVDMSIPDATIPHLDATAKSQSGVSTEPQITNTRYKGVELGVRRTEDLVANIVLADEVAKEFLVDAGRVDSLARSVQ